MNNNGFIKVYRKIKEWKYWGNPTARALWLYLLIEANWKKGYLSNGEAIPRGTLARTLQRMSDDTGLSVSTIRRWLKKFENDGQILIKGTNKKTLISIVAYSKYQGVDSWGEQTDEQPSEQTDEQPSEQTDEQPSEHRYKNNKNIRKKEERESIAPALDEIKNFVKENGLNLDPQYFFDYYSEAGFPRSWKATARRWSKENNETEKARRQDPKVVPLPKYMQKQKEEMLQEKKESEDDFWWMKEN